MPAAAPDSDVAQRARKRIAWRLLPFLFLLYIIAFLDRMNVGNGELIGGNVPLAAALIFGVDEIGTDGLDLIEHILFAGHPNRDHQNQRGGTDDHPQLGEHKAHLIAAKGVVGKAVDFAKNQRRRTTRWRRGSDGTHVF